MSEKFKLFYLDPLSARLFANKMTGGASKSLTEARSILARVRVAKKSKSNRKCSSRKKCSFEKYAYRFAKKNYVKI